MSIPSFSSFPQRNPAKLVAPSPPPATSFPARVPLGNDESSRAGPSFSSFPRRPTNEVEVDSSDARPRKRQDAIDEVERKSKDKKRRHREDTDDVGRDRDHHPRRRRDRSRDAYSDDRHDSGMVVKPQDKPEEKERRRSRSRDRRRRDERDRGRDEPRRSRDKHSHLDRDPNPRERERQRERAQHPTISPSETNVLDPKEFYTDTRGDQDILRFGPQRGMRYIPIGKGRIVGLSEAYRLDLREVGGGRGVPVTLKSDSTDETARGSLLLQITGPALRLRFPRGDASKDVDAQEDFISVGKARRKIAPPEQTKDRVEAYWEEQDRRDRSESGSGSENEQEEEAVDLDVELEETEEERRRRRIVDFERRLKERPEDVESWIAYSQLHLSGTSSSGSSAKGNQRGKKSRPEQISTTKQGEAEIATEILSKAFRAFETNKSDPRLHSAFFKLVQLFWPAERVTASWKAVLRELTERQSQGDQAGLMNLWLEFIAWREGRGLGSQKGRAGTAGSTGGVDDVIDVYVECIEVMNNAKKGGGENTRFLEENLVYLLLRCCLLLKHAGYAERATATIQAMLELQNPIDWETSLIQDLEAFWDSEHARIGEATAAGWSIWKRDEKPDLDALAAEAVQETIPSSDNPDPYTRWYQDETSAESRHPRPARALDLAEDDEDPFKTILFSDIESFLFVIEDPEVKLQFAFAAMNLLGVPSVPPGVGSDSPFYTDPHLSWSLDVKIERLWPPHRAQTGLPLIESSSGPSGAEGGVFSCPLKAWAMDQETICQDVQPWFSTIDKNIDGQCDLALVGNVLRQLQSVILEPTFKTAYLAIESLRSRKGATRAAKTLIAADQRNLELYASYARTLRQQNKLKEARQVYAMCLQTMTGDVDQVDVHVRHQLSLEWAQMEYLAGEDRISLNVLISVASGLEQVELDDLNRAPTGVAILKARNAFTRADPDDPCWTKLRYLYRVQQESFELVFKDLQSEVQLLPSNTSVQEQLGQFACQLAWAHRQRRYVAPTVLRPFLEGLITVYPNNTLFLSLYLANESSSQVFGRVHRTIEDTILNSTESSATAFLWAAWAEARSGRGEFWSSSSAAAERVRHVFDKALEVAGNARRSLAIWKAYIEFEALQGRSDAAKQLCYRALGEIGTAKELYMLPFSPFLRQYFTAKELQDWAEIMIEKGIRIRLPFEQYWRSTSATDYLDRDDGGDPMKEEDRVFDFLQERKTLMPY